MENSREERGCPLVSSNLQVEVKYAILVTLVAGMKMLY